MLFFSYGNELVDRSFAKIVTAGSLGNLGSSNPVCSKGFFDTSLTTSSALLNPYGSISLSCSFGELYGLKTFG